jgi:hypothetical protein
MSNNYRERSGAVKGDRDNGYSDLLWTRRLNSEIRCVKERKLARELRIKASRPFIIVLPRSLALIILPLVTSA